MVGSVCAFNSYTFTLNLLCKHTRLVSVGMFEGYAYTLNLLCIRLYFIMYMSLRFVLMLFLFLLYVLQCPVCLAFLVRMCVAIWQC